MQEQKMNNASKLRNKFYNLVRVAIKNLKEKEVDKKTHQNIFELSHTLTHCCATEV